MVSECVVCPKAWCPGGGGDSVDVCHELCKSVGKPHSAVCLHLMTIMKCACNLKQPEPITSANGFECLVRFKKNIVQS